MKKKFTLIELIIVIVVIGILAAMTMPKFTRVVREAKLSAMINDKEVLEKTMILYYQKYDKLPLLNENQELIVLNNDISLVKLVQAEEVISEDMRTIYTSLQETLKHYNDNEENLYRIDTSKVKDSLSKKLKYGTKKEEKDFYVYSTKTNNVYYYNIMLNGDGEIQHSEFNTKLKETTLVDKKFSYNLGDIPENIPNINEKPIVELINNVNTILPSSIINWEYNFIDEDKNPTKISFVLNDVEYDDFNSIPTKLSEGDYTIKLKMQDSKGLWSDEIIKQFKVFDRFIVKDNKFEAGYFHSMALNINNELYSWGGNTYGQLGIGNTLSQIYPQKVNFPNNAKVLFFSSRGYHTLAMCDDGNLYSWGNNNYGQLGRSNSNSTLPQKVNFPNGVKPISLYTQELTSYAMCDDGNVYGWGFNSYGNIGIGNFVTQSTPQKITLPNNVKIKKFFISSLHAMAIGEDDILYSWGWNKYGQLGIGNLVSQSSPQKVLLPNDVKAKSVFINGNYSMVLGNDNILYSWGENSYGQLGIGNTTNQVLPRKVLLPNDIRVTNVFIGIYGNMILCDDNNIYVCGLNDYGQLGTKDTNSVITPIKVDLKSSINLEKASLGFSHTLLVDKEGTLNSLGSNGNGALGIPNITSTLEVSKVYFK